MLVTKLTLGGSKAKAKRNAQELRGAQALHRRSLELSGLIRQNPITRSKNLIGALLSHGARTRRATKANVNIRLRVYSPAGNRAVKFGYN